MHFTRVWSRSRCPNLCPKWLKRLSPKTANAIDVGKLLEKRARLEAESRATPLAGDAGSPGSDGASPYGCLRASTPTLAYVSLSLISS
jgi:hypothetical protein